MWPLVQSYWELNWSFKNLYALKVTTTPAFHASSSVWEGRGPWWRCAREPVLRRGQMLGWAGTWPMFRCLWAFLKADTLLTPTRKIQAAADGPSRFMWLLCSGVLLFVCIVNTGRFFKVSSIQRCGFGKSVPICFYLAYPLCVWERKFKKCLWRSLKCYCIHLKQWNSMSHCLFFIWHSLRTWVLMGKM